MGRSNKQSEDVSWKAYYDVEEVHFMVEDGDLGSHWDKHSFIVDKNTREKLHGPYRDYAYARKQAKRKYKKVVRNMERLLMS